MQLPRDRPIYETEERAMNPQNQTLSSAVEAIGNTPLVRLSRITKGLDGEILAKLDYLNPGLSKKDRIALQIIEDAESEGGLKPGQSVVELTSGNTGTGLAIVCATKGYPFVAVMSKGNSVDMARRLAREEGIFAGFSSGANVAAALHLLQTSFKGKTIAVILCDSGLKYLSTDLWI